MVARLGPNMGNGPHLHKDRTLTNPKIYRPSTLMKRPKVRPSSEIMCD